MAISGNGSSVTGGRGDWASNPGLRGSVGKVSQF